MKENGITLIKFFIIILIILVLITICVSTISDSYKIYNLKRYVSEMTLIQEKINQIRNDYKVWENYNPNETGNFYSYLQSLNFINASSASNIYIDKFNKIIDDLNKNDLKYWNKNADSIITNYYYFDPARIEKNFGINDSNLYIIINFYTGNVISRDGIEDVKNKKIIYRGYDSSIGNKLVINNIYNDDIKTEIKIIENRGLKQTVKISLLSDDIKTLPNISEIYYFSNKNEEIRKKCSMLPDYRYIETEKSAYFTIETSGEYEFIIEDTNFIQYSAIRKSFKLCNPPILNDEMTGIYWNGDEEKEIEGIYDSNWYNYSEDELKMANAKTTDGIYWVWIPRFIYRETEEGTQLEFVYDKSSTPTTNLLSNVYKVQEAFSENGEITGFWIAKFQSNSEDSVIIKPGLTLAITDKTRATQNSEKYLNDNKLYSILPTLNKLNAIIILANSYDIEIVNDLVSYAGGSTNELGYMDNVKYSSSNNIYGVYDVITSENELLQESKPNEKGRFRPVLMPK